LKIIETKLPGVLILEPQVFGDTRGFFQETFSAKRYAEAGINETFVQDNHSRSGRGVLRGLHYQCRQPQGKLIYVTRGEVFDVVVDIRSGSPTYGQYVSIILNDTNHLQFYAPPGYAHGFCVLSEVADFVYKCTDYYHPPSERGVLWDDPQLAIEWPLDAALLSEKDTKNPRLQDIKAEELPEYASE